jgi:hypothetical protein
LAEHRLLLSADLAIPPEVVTQKLAIIAESGGGKSYTASKLSELMLEVGAQVIIADPVGIWSGIRSGADGKSPGYAVVVFGGEHGDLPLPPESGALVARLLAERGVSAVLDVSEMSSAELVRFMADFAEAFLKAKKRHRSPVHIVFEEAHVFVPQEPQKGEGPMLARIERLLKIGRNFGVGWTLVTQEPQSVRKRSLNLAGTVIVLRTSGLHERKAVAGWMASKHLREADLNLVELLPELATGEAVVWSPGWLKQVKRIKVAKKKTFDASATPALGAEALQPRHLAAVDVAQLRQALAAEVERAQQEDPGALRARVAQLQAELARARAAAPAPAAKGERVEVPVIKPAELKRLEGVVGRVEKALEVLANSAGLLGALHLELKGQLEGVRAAALRAVAGPPPARVAPAPAPVRPAIVPRQRPSRDVSGTPAGQGGRLPSGARDMLTALATSRLPSLTRQQVAMLAGLKVSGGTFAKYLSTLRTRGDVADAAGGTLQITEAGLEAIGGRPPQPQTPAEVVDLWKGKLPGKARDMLDHVIAATPGGGLSRAGLAAAVGIEESGGTFAKYLSLLSTNGLVEKRAGFLVAAPDLVGGAGGL